MSMKNSNDTIGNRTRDLPACSAVPQPTAPQRAPFSVSMLLFYVRESKYDKVVTPRHVVILANTCPFWAVAI